MEFQGIPRNFNQFKWVNMSLCSLMMKVFKKDHCQLTYKPGSQDAITTKNEMIYNLLYLYVLRLKIRLDRHLFLRVRCLVVIYKIFCEKNFKIGVFLTSKIQFYYFLQSRQGSATVTTVVQTDSALHWREYKKWILLVRKTPILKIFSQNILYLCVEHYFGTENFIRKYGTS